MLHLLAVSVEQRPQEVALISFLCLCDFFIIRGKNLGRANEGDRWTVRLEEDRAAQRR